MPPGGLEPPAHRFGSQENQLICSYFSAPIAPPARLPAATLSCGLERPPAEYGIDALRGLQEGNNPLTFADPIWTLTFRGRGYLTD